MSTQSDSAALEVGRSPSNRIGALIRAARRGARRNPTMAAGIAIVLVMALAAIFAPLLFTTDPSAVAAAREVHSALGDPLVRHRQHWKRPVEPRAVRQSRLDDGGRGSSRYLSPRLDRAGAVGGLLPAIGRGHHAIHGRPHGYPVRAAGDGVDGAARRQYAERHHRAGHCRDA